VLPPAGFSEKQIESFGERTLLGRWGTPEDVAQAVRYLIAADYVTGEVITVDGGERYWRG
jgi:NAD(P)-dependent dehydrogenase (short-subunit alcohol dehydrogenase family)